MKISVVINTLNEELNIERAIKSVKRADEILVCDMHSDDKTAEIANRLGAKVIVHDQIGFVEPARNFAISKTLGDWILILDADEEVSGTLWEKLNEIADDNKLTFVRIPRKNIIFNKWIKNSMWWPDYNIRFFKKDSVVWGNKIHRPPETKGAGADLDMSEDLAITHYHYQTVSQFVERMNRYTNIQADELLDTGYKFDWKDLITHPVNEFLGRYFANKGYQDGLHGLALCLLQSFSFLTMYLKVWEKEKFREEAIRIQDIELEFKKNGRDLIYWINVIQSDKNPIKVFLQKIKNLK